MDDPATGRPAETSVSPPTAPRTTAAAPSALGDLRLVRSEDLMQGAREVIILHNDQRYRLVETRNGKLILQK
jgi:hemin uptake protein HemP